MIFRPDNIPQRAMDAHEDAAAERSHEARMNFLSAKLEKLLNDGDARVERLQALYNIQEITNQIFEATDDKEVAILYEQLDGAILKLKNDYPQDFIVLQSISDAAENAD